MYTPGCEKLTGPHKHVLVVVLALLVILEGQVRAFRQVCKKSLHAYLLQLHLHAAVVDSLCQALESLGHQYVLSISSLPLTDHTSAHYSLEEDIA